MRSLSKFCCSNSFDFYYVVILNELHEFWCRLFYPLEKWLCFYRLSLMLCFRCPFQFLVSLACFIVFCSGFANYFLQFVLYVWLLHIFFILPFGFYLSDSIFGLYDKFIYVSAGVISIAYWEPKI